MRKYEYKVAVIPVTVPITTKQYEKNAYEIEVQLNKFGQEGWELLQHVNGLFFFKREIE